MKQKRLWKYFFIERGEHFAVEGSSRGKSFRFIYLKPVWVASLPTQNHVMRFSRALHASIANLKTQLKSKGNRSINKIIFKKQVHAQLNVMVQKPSSFAGGLRTLSVLNGRVCENQIPLLSTFSNISSGLSIVFPFLLCTPKNELCGRKNSATRRRLFCPHLFRERSSVTSSIYLYCGFFLCEERVKRDDCHTNCGVYHRAFAELLPSTDKKFIGYIVLFVSNLEVMWARCNHSKFR